MKKNDRPLILVTNDDGINAKGIRELVDAVKICGDIFVIAPKEGHSGMSHAITIKYPIHAYKIKGDDNINVYACKGTPVDSVKLAINELMDRKPDLVVSGINHGSNASTSVVYSGTMAAAIEGCLNGIPSIGFSILDHSRDADFTLAKKYVTAIVRQVLENELSMNTCLNVNFPMTSPVEVKGIRICRQVRGVWKEKFEKRVDPSNREYYWLTGHFENFEPEATDTDEWALKNNYISIVPVKVDLTDYQAIEYIKTWKFDI